MVEVRVREQDKVNGREILDAQAGAFDALEQEQPVGEIRVDENVQVGELDEERGVANPGQRNLAASEFGENRLFMLAGARGQKSLPNHLAEEGPGIEGFGRGQIFERLGKWLANTRRTSGPDRRFCHKCLSS
jgi:hypothetical protein